MRNAIDQLYAQCEAVRLKTQKEVDTGKGISEPWKVAKEARESLKNLPKAYHILYGRIECFLDALNTFFASSKNVSKRALFPRYCKIMGIIFSLRLLRASTVETLILILLNSEEKAPKGGEKYILDVLTNLDTKATCEAEDRTGSSAYGGSLATNPESIRLVKLNVQGSYIPLLQRPTVFRILSFVSSVINGPVFTGADILRPETLSQPTAGGGSLMSLLQQRIQSAGADQAGCYAGCIAIIIAFIRQLSDTTDGRVLLLDFTPSSAWDQGEDVERHRTENKGAQPVLEYTLEAIRPVVTGEGVYVRRSSLLFLRCLVHSITTHRTQVEEYRCKDEEVAVEQDNSRDLSVYGVPNGVPGVLISSPRFFRALTSLYYEYISPSLNTSTSETGSGSYGYTSTSSPSLPQGMVITSSSSGNGSNGTTGPTIFVSEAFMNGERVNSLNVKGALQRLNEALCRDVIANLTLVVVAALREATKCGVAFLSCLSPPISNELKDETTKQSQYGTMLDFADDGNLLNIKALETVHTCSCINRYKKCIMQLVRSLSEATLSFLVGSPDGQSDILLVLTNAIYNVLSDKQVSQGWTLLFMEYNTTGEISRNNPQTALLDTVSIVINTFLTTQPEVNLVPFTDWTTQNCLYTNDITLTNALRGLASYFNHVAARIRHISCLEADAMASTSTEIVKGIAFDVGIIMRFAKEETVSCTKMFDNATAVDTVLCCIGIVAVEMLNAMRHTKVQLRLLEAKSKLGNGELGVCAEGNPPTHECLKFLDSKISEHLFVLCETLLTIGFTMASRFVSIKDTPLVSTFKITETNVCLSQDQLEGKDSQPKQQQNSKPQFCVPFIFAALYMSYIASEVCCVGDGHEKQVVPGSTKVIPVQTFPVLSPTQSGATSPCEDRLCSPLAHSDIGMTFSELFIRRLYPRVLLLGAIATRHVERAGEKISVLKDSFHFLKQAAPFASGQYSAVKPLYSHIDMLLHGGTVGVRSASPTDELDLARSEYPVSVQMMEGPSLGTRQTTATTTEGVPLGQGAPLLCSFPPNLVAVSPNGATQSSPDQVRVSQDDSNLLQIQLNSPKLKKKISDTFLDRFRSNVPYLAGDIVARRLADISRLTRHVNPNATASERIGTLDIVTACSCHAAAIADQIVAVVRTVRLADAISCGDNSNVSDLVLHGFARGLSWELASGLIAPQDGLPFCSTHCDDLWGTVFVSLVKGLNFIVTSCKLASKPGESEGATPETLSDMFHKLPVPSSLFWMVNEDLLPDLNGMLSKENTTRDQMTQTEEAGAVLCRIIQTQVRDKLLTAPELVAIPVSDTNVFGVMGALAQIVVARVREASSMFDSSFSRMVANRVADAAKKNASKKGGATTGDITSASQFPSRLPHDPTYLVALMSLLLSYVTNLRLTGLEARSALAKSIVLSLEPCFLIDFTPLDFHVLLEYFKNISRLLLDEAQVMSSPLAHAKAPRRVGAEDRGGTNIFSLATTYVSSTVAAVLPAGSSAATSSAAMQLKYVHTNTPVVYVDLSCVLPESVSSFEAVVSDMLGCLSKFPLSKVFARVLSEQIPYQQDNTGRSGSPFPVREFLKSTKPLASSTEAEMYYAALMRAVLHEPSEEDRRDGTGKVGWGSRGGPTPPIDIPFNNVLDILYLVSLVTQRSSFYAAGVAFELVANSVAGFAGCLSGSTSLAVTGQKRVVNSFATSVMIDLSFRMGVIRTTAPTEKEAQLLKRQIGRALAVAAGESPLFVASSLIDRMFNELARVLRWSEATSSRVPGETSLLLRNILNEIFEVVGFVDVLISCVGNSYSSGGNNCLATRNDLRRAWSITCLFEVLGRQVASLSRLLEELDSAAVTRLSPSLSSILALFVDRVLQASVNIVSSDPAIPLLLFSLGTGGVESPSLRNIKVEEGEKGDGSHEPNQAENREVDSPVVDAASAHISKVFALSEINFLNFPLSGENTSVISPPTTQPSPLAAGCFPTQEALASDLVSADFGLLDALAFLFAKVPFSSAAFDTNSLVQALSRLNSDLAAVAQHEGGVAVRGASRVDVAKYITKYVVSEQRLLLELANMVYAKGGEAVMKILSLLPTTKALMCLADMGYDKVTDMGLAEDKGVRPSTLINMALVENVGRVLLERDDFGLYKNSLFSFEHFESLPTGFYGLLVRSTQRVDRELNETMRFKGRGARIQQRYDDEVISGVASFVEKTFGNTVVSDWGFVLTPLMSVFSAVILYVEANKASVKNDMSLQNLISRVFNVMKQYLSLVLKDKMSFLTNGTTEYKELLSQVITNVIDGVVSLSNRLNGYRGILLSNYRFVFDIYNMFDIEYVDNNLSNNIIFNLQKITMRTYESIITTPMTRQINDYSEYAGLIDCMVRTIDVSMTNISTMLARGQFKALKRVIKFVITGSPNYTLNLGLVENTLNVYCECRVFGSLSSTFMKQSPFSLYYSANEERRMKPCGTHVLALMRLVESLKSAYPSFARCAAAFNQVAFDILEGKK